MQRGHGLSAELATRRLGPASRYLGLPRFMAFRFRDPIDPVTIVHDGRRLPADRGESLAVSLLAADRLLLARSPKLHRPRGPGCLVGGCDGCLARVNGEPNVMTCLRSTTGSERVETQNVLGARGADLLRATDYAFPQGFDHHRLLAGTPILGKAMQGIARRVAGLGRLPEQPAQARERRENLDCEVLVVGSGRRGRAAASELLSQGVPVTMVDDALIPGGLGGVIDPQEAENDIRQLRARGLAVHRAVVLGLYRDGNALGALLLDDTGSIYARPKQVVLEVGCHDETPTFGGNDLPGIFSARAALMAARHGVAVGRQIVTTSAEMREPKDKSGASEASSDGDQGRVIQELRHLLGSHAQFRQVEISQVVGAGRGKRLRYVDVEIDSRRARWDADAMVIAEPGWPRTELAVQAGARLIFNGSTYLPVSEHGSRIAQAVYTTRSAQGPTSLDLAEQLLQERRRSPSPPG